MSKRVKVRQPRDRFDAMVNRCSLATIKTVVGKLTAEELDNGVDVDEFVGRGQVWEHATANADENMDDDVLMSIEIEYEFGASSPSMLMVRKFRNSLPCRSSIRSV